MGSAGGLWVSVDGDEMQRLVGDIEAARGRLDDACRDLARASARLVGLLASPEGGLATFGALRSAVAEATLAAGRASQALERRAAQVREALREYDGADDPAEFLSLIAALHPAAGQALAFAAGLRIGWETWRSEDGMRMRGVWTVLAARESGIAPTAGWLSHHVSPHLGRDPLGDVATILDPIGAAGGPSFLTPMGAAAAPLRRLGTDVVVDPPRPGTSAAAGGVGDLAARIGVAYDDVPDGAGAVDIQRIDHADGTVTWTVAVPGTQGFGASYGASTVPMAGDVNPAAFLGMPGAPDGLVLAAMEQAGIGPDEPVLLAGHSLAGMVVMRLASAPEVTSRYSVAGVVTFGSPVGHLPAASVPTLHVRHAEDGTPSLSGVAGSRAGGSAPGEVVVVKQLGDDAGGMSTAHGIGTYEATAREVEARAHPGLARWEEVTNGLWAREGDTVTSTLHAGRVR